MKKLHPVPAIILCVTVILCLILLASGILIMSNSREIQFDYEYLSEDLQEVQIVNFIHFSETEYDKDGPDIQYDVILTLQEEKMDALLKDLSQIKFKTMTCPPQSFEGCGVILRYTDEEIYISCESIEDEKSTWSQDISASDDLMELLERTLGYDVK